MKSTNKASKVAIIGLGRVGSAFLKKLSEFEGKAICIVAAAECDQEAPGVAAAKKLGIEIFENYKEITEIADDIDVIFDLSGNSQVERWLRSALVMKDNFHTAIVSRSVAVLFWNLFAEGFLPEHTEK